MNDFSSFFAGTFLRASYLMIIVLLIASAMQRRRPLVASSLLSAAMAGLLLLPASVAFAPHVRIPVWNSVPAVADSGKLDALITPDERLPLNNPDFETTAGQMAAKRSPFGTDVGDTAPNRLDSQTVVASADENRQQETVPDRLGAQASAAPSISEWTISRTAALIAIYLIGVIFLSIRFCISLVSLRTLCKSATPVAGECFERMICWRNRLGESRDVRLLSSDRISVPFTVGWLRPVIVLPSSIRTQSPRQQDAVLLHELAHIRRCDYLDVMMLQIVQIIYWPNPLAWLMGWSSQSVRERICDDVCIHWIGDSGSYRDALIEIARQMIGKPCLALGLAILRTSRLSRRIDHIICSPGNSNSVPTVSIRSLIIGLALTFTAAAALIEFVPRIATAQFASDQKPNEPTAPKAAKQNAPAERSIPLGKQPNLLRLSADDVAPYERNQATLENRGQSIDSLVWVFGSSLLKHHSWVTSVGWTPDGAILGSAGSDGCLRLWNPDTGAQLKRFKSEPAWLGGAPGISRFAFDPAGRHVAAAIPTNAVRVWNLESGVETYTLKDKEQIFSVAWHPNQSIVATAGQRCSKLWDLSTGQVIREFAGESHQFAASLLFNPDGSRLVVAGPDGAVRFWNVATGELSQTIKVHDRPTTSLSVDFPQDLIATGADDGVLRVWKISTGERRLEIHAHEQSVQEIAFDSPHNSLFSGGRDGIRRWDLANGDKLLEIRSPANGGTGSLALHPKRDLLASAGLAIGVWNTSTGQPQVESTGHAGGIHALAFTRDGSMLFSGGNDGTVRVWQPGRRESINSFDAAKSYIMGLALLDDGQSFATSADFGGSVDIFRVDDGTKTVSMKLENAYRGRAVVVSPDGRWLVTNSFATKGASVNLEIWDLKNQKRHAGISAPEGIPHFNHDGSLLLIAGSGQRGIVYGEKCPLVVWDVTNLKKVLELENPEGISSITATAVSHDGKTVALFGSAYDQDQKRHNRIVFWDWTKNEARLVIEAEEHWPKLMDFAPDGRSLISIAPLEGEIRVWDARDGSLREQIALCEGSHWSIGAASFAPDSRHIAVARGNGTIDLIRIRRPADDVPIKISVPEPFVDPPTDQWRSLIGQQAPELESHDWLLGEPTSLKQLRGRWVALYFWNSVFASQDLPGWLYLKERFDEKDLTAIIIRPSYGQSLEKEREWFEGQTRNDLQGRSLPFRVLLDQQQPNTIPGTGIQTGGSTFAAYRVMNAYRGRVTDSVALLIDPEGIVVKQIPNRIGESTIRDLESVTGRKAITPKWETDFLKEYSLKENEILRRRAPPFSQARENYRYFSHGRMPRIMTFEQREELHPAWATGGAEVTLGFVFDTVVKAGSYEFIDPDDVASSPISGDWCFRPEVSSADRLLELERILRSELDWKIHFESTMANQQVVVLSGDWKPASLPGLEDKPGLYLTIDDAPDPDSGGGGRLPFDEILKYLGDRLRIRFINEAGNLPEGELTWQDRTLQLRDDIRKRTPTGNEKLASLLEKLEKQTGLTCKLENRLVPVWQIKTE